MAKTRVHELAKEFGVESKFVLEKLKEMGEFVKSASSTVEPPVNYSFWSVAPRRRGNGTASGCANSSRVTHRVLMSCVLQFLVGGADPVGAAGVIGAREVRSD